MTTYPVDQSWVQVYLPLVNVLCPQKTQESLFGHNLARPWTLGGPCGSSMQIVGITSKGNQNVLYTFQRTLKLTFVLLSTSRAHKHTQISLEPSVHSISMMLSSCSVLWRKLRHRFDTWSPLPMEMRMPPWRENRQFLRSSRDNSQRSMFVRNLNIVQ